MLDMVEKSSHPNTPGMIFEVEKSCLQKYPRILVTHICIKAYMLPKKFSEWYLLFAPEVMQRLLTFTCFDLGYGVMTVMDQKGCTLGPQEVESDVHEPHSCCSNRTTCLACTYAHGRRHDSSCVFIPSFHLKGKTLVRRSLKTS